MELLKANAGKLGLVALLLIMAVGVLALFGDRAPSREGKVQFICLATGETFWLKRGEVKILPRANPNTGEKTLLPCHADTGDGTLRVSSRCRSLVERLSENGINQYVDPETLVVRRRP